MNELSWRTQTVPDTNRILPVFFHSTAITFK